MPPRDACEWSRSVPRSSRPACPERHDPTELGLRLDQERGRPIGGNLRRLVRTYICLARWALDPS